MMLLPFKRRLQALFRTTSWRSTYIALDDVEDKYEGPLVSNHNDDLATDYSGSSFQALHNGVLRLRSSTIGSLLTLCVVLLLGYLAGSLWHPSSYFSRSQVGLHHDTIRKAVVLSSYKKQNVTWLEELEGWEVVRYVGDDLNAEFTTPRNRGREATAYLTYIVQNYNNLPDYVAFTHGHETGWHQLEPMQLLLRAIDLDLVEELGWVSLRCITSKGCTEKSWMEPAYKGDHNHKKIGNLFTSLHHFLYRPEDPWYRPEVPKILAAPLGAQFAVSRAAILAQPLEFWTRLRMPLLRDYKELDDWWNEKTPNEWRMGVIYEHGWHYFFGKDARVCLDEQYCRDTVFQGKIMCEGKEKWIDRKLVETPHCWFQDNTLGIGLDSANDTLAGHYSG